MRLLIKYLICLLKWQRSYLRLKQMVLFNTSREHMLGVRSQVVRTNMHFSLLGCGTTTLTQLSDYLGQQMRWKHGIAALTLQLVAIIPKSGLLYQHSSVNKDWWNYDKLNTFQVISRPSERMPTLVKEP